MESRRPAGNIVFPLPTDSIALFLGYMRRFSDFVASDARPIPSLLQEHQSNVNNDSSPARVSSGTFRRTFENHNSIDVTNQQNFFHFAESPSLRRAG